MDKVAAVHSNLGIDAYLTGLTLDFPIRREQSIVSNSLMRFVPEIWTLAITFFTCIRKVANFSFHGITKIIWFIAPAHIDFQFRSFISPQNPVFLQIVSYFYIPTNFKLTEFLQNFRSFQNKWCCYPSRIIYWADWHVQLVDLQHLNLGPLSSDGVIPLELLLELLCCW